jgi:hypothetical protein
MIVSIPAEEWAKAYLVTPHLENELKDLKGYVLLRATDGHRWWMAHGESTAVCMKGGSDIEEYSLNLPINIFQAFRSVITEVGEVCLDFEDDDSRLIASYEGISFSFERPSGEHPALDLDFARPEDSAVAKVSGAAFARAFVAQPVFPVNNEQETCPIEVRVIDGYVGVSSNFDGIGWTTLAVDCGYSGETRFVNVYPENFKRILNTYSFVDEVEISLSPNPNAPIRFDDGETVALLRIVENNFLRATRHVHKIVEAELGVLAVEQDDDGDYPLRRFGIPIYGRMLDASPPLFQVFAVVLDGIESSPELLTELNEYNSNIEQARIFHVDDQVLAEVDLVAESLDRIELRTSMNRIATFAEKIAPTLQIVFGGDELIPVEDERWANYKRTLISAEVSPNQTVLLNGPDAVADWPFPGAAYVITGWNPQGLEIPGDNTNALIAKDVLAAGGRVAVGSGRSLDGEYAEPSIIAWGIELDDARNFGRRVSQDAIFMIDEEHVYLVACAGDKTEHWPRLISAAD